MPRSQSAANQRLNNKPRVQYFSDWMSNMIGITAWGTYIPRARLSKQAMADANTWFDAGLKSLAKGERSVCNWDEDSITMAVEAGQDCLSALHDKAVTSLYLASSSLPFLDRQNSVVGYHHGVTRSDHGY
jgi:3-hydroxy-3-methylglutaryl CoA synthase